MFSIVSRRARAFPAAIAALLIVAFCLTACYLQPESSIQSQLFLKISERGSKTITFQAGYCLVRVTGADMLPMERKIGPGEASVYLEVPVGEDRLIELTVYADPASAGALYSYRGLGRIDEIAPGRKYLVELELELFERRIAFQSNREGQHEVYLMDPDGSNVRRMTRTAAGKHSWYPESSPDGATIAYHTDEDTVGYQIWTMQAGGTARSNLTNDTSIGDAAAAWSPDGSQIAFYTTRFQDSLDTFDVYAMDADGGSPRQLTFSSGVDNRNPDWSPDGSQIVYQTTQEGDWEIYVMDSADGSNKRNLSDEHPGQDEEPSWSPDGAKIAFSSNREGSYDIWIMDADGGNQRRLTANPTDDRHPSWSLDGSKIVFSSFRQNNWDIYTINADGTGEIRLTTDPAVDSMPTW
jgi:TolB protein